MFDSLMNGSDLEKGLFVTLVGILGVFLVLILFYLVIRIVTRFIPHKSEESSEIK
jgi:Na+-transporting methylmalonyl-CoA/oxaloacetate decarboxylase gamma subunit